ncbi:MAG TPA: thioredoxin domain-containing protein [Nocardioides sp.]|uniref:DsbA family protein n=1 Tax=Nocardioides sp. TaxID=35761 RepID=UPI002E318FA8|nr:thioredoxin domain-containing protein [Nocardioides sp.]HEX5090453.1 thioredoxin domain-containing protein [Nocardioides sp.]
MNTNLSNKEKQRRHRERVAAARRERERRERRRRVLTVVGVVTAVALVVVASLLYASTRDDDSGAEAGSIPPPGSDYGVTLGPASAPHKVVVYEDFLCQDCGEFEKAGHEQLEQLAGQGKVQVEYRPLVTLQKLGEYSARATLMWWLVLQHDGDAVAQKFHDLLYANQPSEKGPFPSRDDLYPLAGQAGADTVELKASMEAGEGTQEVADGTKQAQALGVDSTLTVVLDGRPFTTKGTASDLAKELIDAVQ